MSSTPSRRGSASLVLGLSACAMAAPAEQHAPRPLTVRLQPVSVTGAATRRVGELTVLAAYELSSDHPRFGGLSGLELTADGTSLVFVSDRGSWLRARLELGADGVLRALADWQIQPIVDSDGHPVRSPRDDAEAVTRTADGAWLIGFEREHRIWRYPGALTGRPVALRLPPALAHAPHNGSLEAITALEGGRLLVLCEHYKHPDGTHRGWIGRDGALQPLAYLPTESFVPTDLALLEASGDVIVLERAFTPRRGNRTRVARLPAASLRPGARLRPRELARLEPPQLVDNFEGLAARSLPGGGYLLYLVSDNNFSPSQRTLLYQLRGPAAAR